MAVARFALGLALAGSAGCSLVSGWSDLQDGTAAAGGGDGGAPDSSGSSGSSSGGSSGSGSSGSGGTDSGAVADSGGGGSGGDASNSSGDASAASKTVLCGASTRCPLEEGCCAAIAVGGGTSTCQAPTASCAAPDTFESCSDSSQCTGLAPTAQCCSGENAGGLTVSCVVTCTPMSEGIGEVVCDPTLASPGCPPGKTCQPDPDFDYNTCQ